MAYFKNAVNFIKNIFKERIPTYNDVSFTDTKFMLGDYLFYDVSECYFFESEKGYKKRYQTFMPSIDDNEKEIFFDVMKKLPYPKNVYDVRYCIENFNFVIYLSFSDEKIKNDKHTLKEDNKKQEEKQQRINSLLKLNENV